MITDLVNVVAAERSPGTPVLHLFAGPYVMVRRRRLEIPEGSKRLIAFAALHTGMVARLHERPGTSAQRCGACGATGSN